MVEENTESGKNLEVEKYLKKIKDQQAQIQAMMQAQQEAEMSMVMQQQMEQQMKEQQWTNEHKMLVPKKLLEDCYLFNITGDFNSLFQSIENLSIAIQQSQTNDETRMLIEKSLVVQLMNYTEEKNRDGMYATMNGIFRSMSIFQREELVKPLIREIQEKGEMQHAHLIEALRESIYNSSFFI